MVQSENSNLSYLSLYANGMVDHWLNVNNVRNKIIEAPIKESAHVIKYLIIGERTAILAQDLVIKLENGRIR